MTFASSSSAEGFGAMYQPQGCVGASCCPVERPEHGHLLIVENSS